MYRIVFQQARTNNNIGNNEMSVKWIRLNTFIIRFYSQVNECPYHTRFSYFATNIA